MKFGRQHWVEEAEAAMRTRARDNISTPAAVVL
jgi:hypothetical protein